ncbi:MAG: septum formation protein Maf [Ruminococcaceae bacterium]|nr:septum formation protein Maf [Oscillospiraceae bacterium]
MKQIILASKSPRRHELMGLITERFIVADSLTDESTITEREPSRLCTALARLKCKAVAEKRPEDVVIGCDTIVYLNGDILGKPASREEAFSMLRRLSGNTPTVYTGVWVCGSKVDEGFFVKTDVTFLEMSDKEINDYIDSGDPYDKAGGYGIQNKAARFVRSINGDYFNVMGLPVSALYVFLKNHSLL